MSCEDYEKLHDILDNLWKSEISFRKTTLKPGSSIPIKLKQLSVVANKYSTNNTKQIVCEINEIIANIVETSILEYSVLNLLECLQDLIYLKPSVTVFSSNQYNRRRSELYIVWERYCTQKIINKLSRVLIHIFIVISNNKYRIRDSAEILVQPRFVDKMIDNVAQEMNFEWSVFFRIRKNRTAKTLRYLINRKN